MTQPDCWVNGTYMSWDCAKKVNTVLGELLENPALDHQKALALLYDMARGVRPATEGCEAELEFISDSGIGSKYSLQMPHMLKAAVQASIINVALINQPPAYEVVPLEIQTKQAPRRPAGVRVKAPQEVPPGDWVGIVHAISGSAASRIAKDQGGGRRR